MNIKILVVLLLAFVLVLPDSDAWVFGRRRRRWRFRIRKLICKVSCGPQCRITKLGQKVCSVACHRICGRKKRDLSSVDQYSEDEKQRSIEDSHKILFPFPYKMSVYDKNKDKKISIDELREVLPKQTSKKSIVQAFTMLDQNGDGFIDCKEFHILALEKPVKC